MSDPDATCAFAKTLGATLHAGDVLLLSGGIGAGKTHFARCLIQSLQDRPEEVPSPSFTLVQVYDTRAGELWHSDLYRLGAPEDCDELGLSEAFETAICLVEWPDRLGPLSPDAALSLDFAVGATETEREVALEWTSDRWDAVLKKVAP